MGMDYKIYENWYKYMSNVFDQIQSFSNTYGQSSISSVKQSSDTFMDTLMKINALRSQGEDEAQIGSQGADASEQSMDAIFAEAAERYGVPLNLLKAMGKDESGFDANAVSPAGAQGVMQLMPSTAKSLGVEDPFDARSNIMGGAKYIAQKLQQYNGDVDLALAAYNAGIGHVLDAIALAEKYGKNKYVWDNSVDNYILLKSNEEYFNDPVCKNGYFRGVETYNFVKEVMSRGEVYKKKIKD